MDLLQDYRNIVEKIKEYIKTELEKRYDVKFEDDIKNLLTFTINNYLFELTLENQLIYISYLTVNANDYEVLETFEDIYKYIDDVINDEEKIKKKQ